MLVASFLKVGTMQTHPTNLVKTKKEKKRKGTFQYHENPNPVLLRVRFINQY